MNPEPSLQTNPAASPARLNLLTRIGSAVPGPYRVAAVVALVMAATGCAQLSRTTAVPAVDTARAIIPGIPNARFVGGDTAAMVAEFRRSEERQAGYFKSIGQPLPPASYLAISGGGDNGAFGAGLLVGWSQHGGRPAFDGVTGISTGALTAPFAFLGSEYDPVLTEVYTTTTQKDIFEQRPILAAVGSDGLSDTTPLKNLIARYLDEQMIDRIATEYGRGRLLFIITTDLDAGRPAIWNVGAIAESRRPNAVALIRQVLLASAAIPALFPPVMFDVAVDGVSYQELHVDGGAVMQTFLYPPTIAVGKLPGISPRRSRTAYIIRNGKLREDWNETERKTLSIATRAVPTLTTSSGVGDLYRIYATTKRDGVGLKLAFIQDDFAEPHVGEFDRDYMNKLFEYAHTKSKAGYPWWKGPPGFQN
jgi:hypothetical protein